MASDIGGRNLRRWLPSLENSKLGLTIARDLIIVVVFLLLLTFPAIINDRLVNAGFEEGSFAGLKWKRKVVAADGDLKEARVQITELRKQLDVTQKALEQRSQAPGTPRVDIQQIQQENARVTQNSSAALRAIEQTIDTNERLVAQAADSLSSDARWIVIFGGDATPAAAEDEIRRALRAGIQEPVIVQRRNSYRSVAILPTREAALAVLPNARRLRPDAYAVSLASWCPRSSSGPGYMVCQ